ncbi:MAG: ATP-binding cassette domain-containing protein [Anaerolineae bacterium]|nr:ATP-binding cassette domain-containing protein [Anaerolineae bacterium]
MRSKTMQPLLTVTNLSKSYGIVPALQNVSFRIYPGEVVGVTGQSGAGKSVLAMLIAGIEEPDAGDIALGKWSLKWPYWARSLGIEMIPQVPILTENLDITSNIFLGYETGWPSPGKLLTWLNPARMDEKAALILAQLDAHFTSLRQKVTDLSSEQRQLIAIARVMTHPAKLILVDDPTALLNFSYQKKLLSLIQTWQQDGTSVIFNSHNLDHLFAVTDRILVLRQGRLMANYLTDETSREEIVSALLGTIDREQLTPAIWALDSYYRANQHAERLHNQQQLLERNLAEQGSLNQQLIEQLSHQVKALDKANMALQDAQRRLLTEREQERKHLARELHDQMIQDLLGMNYQFEELEADADIKPQMVEQMTTIRQQMRSFIRDLRRICEDLRPPVIDSLGLGVALESCAWDWSERTGIRVNLELDPNLGRLPETTELSIFRIVQEGLNNVRKHAKANTVKVGLKHTSPRMLQITIIDNGQGIVDDFNLSKLARQGHYGLLGISERVALLGGRLKMQNQNNGGFSLQVEIPHPRVEMVINSDRA